MCCRLASSFSYGARVNYFPHLSTQKQTVSVSQVRPLLCTRVGSRTTKGTSYGVAAKHAYIFYSFHMLAFVDAFKATGSSQRIMSSAAAWQAQSAMRASQASHTPTPLQAAHELRRHCCGLQNWEIGHECTAATAARTMSLSAAHSSPYPSSWMHASFLIQLLWPAEPGERTRGAGPRPQRAPRLPQQHVGPGLLHAQLHVGSQLPGAPARHGHPSGQCGRR